MNRLLVFLLILFAASCIHAEVQYIDDTLLAPIRSGKGNEYRIVHKGLKSGTPVEVLENDADSGYSLVRTQQGLEGWLPTRFLTPQPIARDRLEKLAGEFDQLKARLGELQGENSRLSEENRKLSTALQQSRVSLDGTQAELVNIKRVSENALQLDATNRDLRESNERLKNEVEVLTSENLRLKDKNQQDTMLLGAGLVFLGVLIAVIVPMFKRNKRDTW